MKNLILKSASLLMCSMLCVSCAIVKPKQKANIPTKQKFDTAVVKLTAYTHSERDHRKYGKKTAIGTQLKPGVIATDWSVFPVGTKLMIDGKVYVTEDYGRALVRPSGAMPVVDIYKPSKQKMRQFGAQVKEIKIIENGCIDESVNILKHRLKYAHCRTMYNRLNKKLTFEGEIQYH